jgi:hypothetical protein
MLGIESGEVAEDTWCQKSLRAVSISGVVTVAQCEAVKQDALATGLTRIGSIAGKRRQLRERVCDEACLPRTPERDWLYELILAKSEAVNQENWRFALTGVEDFRVIRYRPGGRAAWHFDKFLGSPRKITCVVSLSSPDSYWRGGLRVRSRHEGKAVAPLQGSATWFPAYLEHRATAPWRGERWVLVTSLTGPAWV